MENLNFTEIRIVNQGLCTTDPPMMVPNNLEPEFYNHEGKGAYRFQCPSAGPFQCSITGLVFRMEGEGEVLYRTVHWDRRLLAQSGKRPAGPLFNIDCPQKSVCQLHLPHCQIHSCGGCDFLSVAHVTDDDKVEFICPHEITDTHVIININGFSAYGDVTDDDAPISPILAHVLLFYQPLGKRSILNVLLLPSNVVRKEVRELIERDGIREILTTSLCTLTPKQEYTLSTNSVDAHPIQPNPATFVDSYENYVPTFQLFIKPFVEEVNLLLEENKADKLVWNGLVWLPVTPPGGATAGTKNVHFLLLDILEELSRSDLKTFQWYINKGVEEFPSISEGQLEDADRLVTVDRMVQSYCDEGAVKITLEILRKMGRNNLAEELKEKLTKQKVAASDGTEASSGREVRAGQHLLWNRPSMLDVPALLLTSLEELTEEQLKTFQSNLTSVQLSGFPPIPESQLENTDRQDTVDQMVKRYGPETAVKITLNTMRRMDLGDLAEKLERDHMSPPGPSKNIEGNAKFLIP
ncbi:uncharacterized protein LOC115178876 isoform X1 [Salmo trutta]|uniref:uncharacterized protein LOC115178876 isoform X1 n=1 Tax=Salmo trutta TaxID=8032 RepID=UPI0011307C1E|nr:uncharacterized protein LOC115178876 isoform X1 [Salmo trutta]XP_029596122.1 uncharacterized protein LOC115178876 isoform X1 [Salmo trutta]